LNKIKAVHTGVSGFPFGSAAINRCLSIYSILHKSGIEVLAINNKAVHLKNSANKVEKKGSFESVSYVNTTPLIYKPKNPIKRRLNNFFGTINEFLLLFKLGFKREIDVMFFYPRGYFFDLVFYWIFSKIFRFKILSHYVEYRSSFESRKNSFWLRLNDSLFDKHFMFFVDGVIPISEYLIDKVKERKKEIPLLKIPPLIDFNLFKGVEKNTAEKYFLYVGSTSYYKAIRLILDAYELIDNNKLRLTLIVHGPDLNKVKEDVNRSPKKDLMTILSGLDYKDLVQYYKNAEALLIPLSNSIQDKARFPQKISEYLASKNPIITTNYGEIKYYFKDNENAFVAKDNTPEYFSEKMKFIIENSEISKEIGLKGFETGLKYFDNNSYRTELTNFLYQELKID